MITGLPYLCCCELTAARGFIQVGTFIRGWHPFVSGDTPPQSPEYPALLYRTYRRTVWGASEGPDPADNSESGSSDNRSLPRHVFGVNATVFVGGLSDLAAGEKVRLDDDPAPAATVYRIIELSATRVVWAWKARPSVDPASTRRAYHCETWQLSQPTDLNEITREVLVEIQGRNAWGFNGPVLYLSEAEPPQIFPETWHGDAYYTDAFVFNPDATVVPYGPPGTQFPGRWFSGSNRNQVLSGIGGGGEYRVDDIASTFGVIHPLTGDGQAGVYVLIAGGHYLALAQKFRLYLERSVRVTTKFKILGSAVAQTECQRTTHNVQSPTPIFYEPELTAVVGDDYWTTFNTSRMMYLTEVHYPVAITGDHALLPMPAETPEFPSTC